MNKLPFNLSLILLVYFFLLVVINHFQWDFALIGVFTELLTLPALAAVVGLLGYSTFGSLRGGTQDKRLHRKTAGVLSICLIMLVVVTFYLG